MKYKDIPAASGKYRLEIVRLGDLFLEEGRLIHCYYRERTVRFEANIEITEASKLINGCLIRIGTTSEFSRAKLTCDDKNSYRIRAEIAVNELSSILDFSIRLEDKHQQEIILAERFISFHSMDSWNEDVCVQIENIRNYHQDLRSQLKRMASREKESSRLQDAMQNSLSWRIAQPIILLGIGMKFIHMSLSGSSYKLAKSVFKQSGWKGLWKEVRLFFLRRRLGSQDDNNYFVNFLKSSVLTKSERSILIAKLGVEVLPIDVILRMGKSTGWDMLGESLKSLSDQILPPAKVIILIDRESDPACFDEVKSKFSEFDIQIQCNKNQFPVEEKREYFLTMHSGDRIHESALAEMYAFALDQNADVSYADEDEVDQNGNHSNPNFKPGFSLVHLRGKNFVGRIALVKTSRSRAVNLACYDLYLRMAEENARFSHLARLLVHGQTTNNRLDVSEIAASRQSLEEHLNRCKVAAAITWNSRTEAHELDYLCDRNQMVSIIIPFRDQPEVLEICLDSLLRYTRYDAYEIILIDNGSCEQETMRLLERVKSDRRIRIISHDSPFNYSELNNLGVSQARGKYILLLNSDIEITQGDWLIRMAGHIQQKGVGAVGVRLIYPNGTIQHDGVILGVGHVAGHAFRHADPYEENQSKLFGVTRAVSACTAACLLLEKSTYEMVQGLNEKDLTVAYNDVDLCLKIRGEGLDVVFCSEVTLIHHESVSRGEDTTSEKKVRYESEVSYMWKKWGEALSSDPYYNCNLARDREDFKLRLDI